MSRRPPAAPTASGRAVATGSIYSTILIEHTIRAAAEGVSVELLLDVGCGDSPYRDAVDHSSYVGIDRRPAGDGDVVIGDAAALPVVGGVADALLCTEVIEHVPDERLLAAELARVARAGAVLVLSAPFVHGLHEAPYDFRRLTSIGLLSVLEEAGWDVQEMCAIGGPGVVAVDGVVRWSDSWLRRIVRTVAAKGSGTHRRLTSPSPWLQRRLAGAVLSRSRHLGAVDPMTATPRLTLGYVVRAVRRPSPD